MSRLNFFKIGVLIFLEILFFLNVKKGVMSYCWKIYSEQWNKLYNPRDVHQVYDSEAKAQACGDEYIKKEAFGCNFFIVVCKHVNGRCVVIYSDQRSYNSFMI